MSKKLSWFQWVIIIFLTVLSWLNGMIQGDGIYGSLAYALGNIAGILFIVWLLRKFIVFLINKKVIVPIDTKNKTLIKVWKITKIVITCLIGLWLLLFLSGNIMGSLLVWGFIIAIIFVYFKRKEIKSYLKAKSHKSK